MAIFPKIRFLVVILILLSLGIATYWHFLSGYSPKPLFCNTYGGDFPKKWHWQMKPAPLFDPDGTRVFVDFSRNELCIVIDPGGGSSCTLGGYKPNGQDILIGRDWVTMPESPDNCVRVDASGSKVLRSLRPGDAQALFDRLTPLRGTGRLVAELQSVFPGIATTTPSTAPVGP
jgi:hypothetical protein